MLQLRVALVGLLAGYLVFSGASCSKGPQGGPRVETFPVRGRVLIDGQPVANVAVRLHSATDDPAVPRSSSFTDAEGNFTVGTYEAADGAPVGDYTLTFMWGQINLMTGRYEATKDKEDFNKRYSDPETSEFEFTVVAPENDWGTIELTSKE